MATANPIDKELYSLSTEDGKAIPLDVIRPLSMLLRTWGVNASITITIPASWKIATFYSERGCFIQLGGNTIPTFPAENTDYADTLFVPPNIIVTSTVLSGVSKIVPYDTTRIGKVVIQQVQKWSGLALKRQVNKISA